MHVVVGLGNPGAQYVETRHNIGFMVVDALARQWSLGWTNRGAEGAQSLVARGSRRGEEVLLVKPQTFMNASGRALEALSRGTGFDPQEVLVVLDDFNLDFGRLRLRSGGGDGGHNGLASIIDSMGTDEVPRLRLGIGPVPDGDDDVEFVLVKFGPHEDVAALISRGTQAVGSSIAEDFETAMNRFNGNLPL
jgi:PTH1 family peptidyl-tRNA hydrolase